MISISVESIVNVTAFKHTGSVCAQQRIHLQAAGWGYKTRPSDAHHQRIQQPIRCVHLLSFNQVGLKPFSLYKTTSSVIQMLLFAKLQCPKMYSYKLFDNRKVKRF